MKQMPLFAFLFLLNVGCGARYIIIEEPTRDLAGYTSLSVSPLNTSVARMKAPEWGEELSRASRRVSEVAMQKLKEQYRTSSGGKSLRVECELTEFSGGNRAVYRGGQALRWIPGMGSSIPGSAMTRAGRGYFHVRARLIDGATGGPIGECEVRAGAGAGGSLEKSSIYCGEAIANFILDHRE